MTGGDGLYLGVDVGTSATRVSLVRPDGTAVVASAGYRTLVLVDAAGRAVRPALTWQDIRATGGGTGRAVRRPGAADRDGAALVRREPPGQAGLAGPARAGQRAADPVGGGVGRHRRQ
jgi:hypothetical protein